MHRQYADTSHFRAPYKNISIGAINTGDVSSPLEDEYAKYATMFDKKNGVNYWTADARKFAMQALERSHFQVVDGEVGDRVSVIGLTAEEEAAVVANPGAQIAFKASDWVAQKLREGKAVVAPVWLIAPVVGPGRELVAIPVKDKARLAAAASTPIAGILVEPTSGSDLLKIGLIAGGIVVGAIVLGAVVKKGFKANKRRRIGRGGRRTGSGSIHWGMYARRVRRRR